MKKLLVLAMLFGCFSTSFAQSRFANNEYTSDKNIVEIMDYLRGDWDAKVAFIRTLEDLRNLCRNRSFRVDLIELLDEIHHYDTTLYNTVIAKYSYNSDPEARATLDDIEKLEVDYTTRSFKGFVHHECNEYNFVNNNFSKADPEYAEEKARVEVELNKYVNSITWQIDIIDEHAHHLDLRGS